MDESPPRACNVLPGESCDERLPRRFGYRGVGFPLMRRYVVERYGVDRSAFAGPTARCSRSSEGPSTRPP